MNTTIKIVQVDHSLWHLQNPNTKNNSKKFEILGTIFIYLFILYIIDDEKCINFWSQYIVHTSFRSYLSTQKYNTLLKKNYYYTYNTPVKIRPKRKMMITVKIMFTEHIYKL